MTTVRLLGRLRRQAPPTAPVPLVPLVRLVRLVPFVVPVLLVLVLAVSAAPVAAGAEEGAGSTQAAAGSTQAVADAGTPSPWQALDAARRSLAEAGAEQADFTQTYLPAGFSSGEEESGRIALRLPDCLRWDYDEPFPKSFLLCGDQVWSWNPEDRRGQTGSLDRKSQPGLDLLLLPVEQLGTRYAATAESDDGAPGRVSVHLTPKPEVAERTELTGATLVVNTETERLVELSYRDQEGNQTTFVLSNYRPLDDTGEFKAPGGITWEEMQ